MHQSVKYFNFFSIYLAVDNFEITLGLGTVEVEGPGSETDGADAKEKSKSFNLSQLINFESRLPASILPITSPENRKKITKTRI
jgi:hypothetical protein